jgi:hypothetical protein
MTKKIKVIYVMGEGRSGSTILDLLLSNHKRIVGAGELWSFYTGTDTTTGLCTCGLPFKDCNFWQLVRQRYLNEIGGSSIEPIRNQRRYYDRLMWVFPRLLGVHERGFNDYCKSLFSIYKVLAEVSQKEVIVDSTKHIGRAVNLLKCPGIDVFLIHLVRDGRGVIWSRLRDKERDPSLNRKGPLLSTLVWMTKNVLASLVGYFARDRIIKLRYEDLISAPVKELSRIGKLCGLDMDGVLHNLSEKNIHRMGHQIGGNNKARSGDEKLNLRLDEEWKMRLSIRNRFMFGLISGWLARYYGYR